MLSPARFLENRLNVNNQNATARPRLQTKKMRKGIVIEVNEKYGRILCSRTFSDPGVFVFFTAETEVNGTSMRTLQNFPEHVPVGAEVEFRLTYAFPSKWRTFGTYMGYFCQAMNFDASKSPRVQKEELLVNEHRQHGIVVATNHTNAKFIIHPQIWPSPSTIRKLYHGKELEPKIYSRFNVSTQQNRTLRALVLEMPPFLKPKLRHMEYLVVQAQPLSTTVTIYGVIVGGGINEVYFDSVGIRTDTRDDQALPIVMDKQLFLTLIGFDDKTKISKVNVCQMIGQIHQLGCVKNIANSKYPLRAFCARPVQQAPRNPTVHLPKEFAAAQHKAVTKVKSLARPQPRHFGFDEALPFDLVNSYARKNSMKLNKSFTRHQSMNRKSTLRKRRLQLKKRAFTPCSPFTDLTAKKMNLNDSDVNPKMKNLEDSFQNFSITD